MSSEERSHSNVELMPGARASEAVDTDKRVAEKNIVVIMPFGGENRRVERRCILEYMRIKYLIENKVEVSAVDSKAKGSIDYAVSVCRARVGQISVNAFRKIADADIVIALLTEKNVNVTYELAVRNLIKPQYVLIVKGDPGEILPVYLRDMNYKKLDTDDTDGKALQKAMEHLEESDFPVVRWDAKDIPQALTQAIDKHDGALQGSLQGALSDLEVSPPSWPEHMLDLAEELHPGGFLKAWKGYNPMSVIRIKWRQKKDTFAYDPNDMISKPVVYDVNRAFAEVYDFVYEQFPDPDGPRALTAERLLKRIEEYVDKRHMELFLKDQGRVTDDLVFQDKEGKAKIPLQFNDKHRKFPGKVFLPSMIGKSTIGETDRPHTTYLLISYIEDFFPIDDPKTPAETGK